MATTTRLVQHVYTPRGAAKEVFSRRESEVCLVGPAGTGKSLGCLEKMALAALKYPNMRGLITRKVGASLPSSALATWRKLVVPELLGSGQVVFHGGGPQDPPQYRFANGSCINIGGMDKPSKIMSTEYDLVYVQEATELKEDDWESIQTRLRNWVMPYQQVIADCNPSHPTHWLNLRGQSGRTVFLQSRHEDNPALFDDDGNITEAGKAYMDKLDRLTGVRYLRLRKGIWAAAEGVVYEEWDIDKHVVPWFRLPEDWPRYWSIDFGFTHPFVCQWWAVDPDGRLYMYREIYRTKRLVEDHAKHILRCVTNHKGKWTEPKPVAIICDHDAEDRATLERHLGMPTTPAKKSVSDGIQHVQARMKLAEDGKARIFFMAPSLVDRDYELADAKRPSSTPEEIPAYVWARDPNGTLDKETPVKDMDDGCDAMRYMVAQMDLVGRPRLRSFDTFGASSPRRRSPLGEMTGWTRIRSI